MSHIELRAAEHLDASTRVHAIVADGRVVGSALSYDSDGVREVAVLLTATAVDADLATDALRMLVALEPERPLYARVADGDEAGATALRAAGFTEVSPTAGQSDAATALLFTLLPVLDGA